MLKTYTSNLVNERYTLSCVWYLYIMMFYVIFLLIVSIVIRVLEALQIVAVSNL